MEILQNFVAFSEYMNLNLTEKFDGKGVSDLEKCLDYFALPGRSCEILIFTPKRITPEKNIIMYQHLEKNFGLLISDG